MTRSARLPRGARIAAAALAAGLIFTGCSAGQISQTADQVAAVDGANATVGQISVLNAVLAETESAGYPQGGSAQLQFWLSNAGLTADQLTDISSPYATSVQLVGPQELQPQTLADFQNDEAATVTLEGLTQPIVYGHSIPITFTFAQAGAVTVRVPIAIPEKRGDEPRETVNLLPPHPVPLWEEGSHGEEGGEGH